eukprot:TRINITY_DN66423_c4_g15_i2.p1 TRINITY_DN66423_c4_g15~~TRINITY_DN66423_c4_g15_i2.p1  ORF type:complete len:1069 (-),score=678.67 TRINITY_DN66423_c4_g15_i2:126-3230(-)
MSRRKLIKKLKQARDRNAKHVEQLTDERQLNEELTEEVADLTDDFMSSTSKVDELTKKLDSLRAEHEAAIEAAVAAAKREASESKNSDGGGGSKFSLFRKRSSSKVGQATLNKNSVRTIVTLRKSLRALRDGTRSLKQELNENVQELREWIVDAQKQAQRAAARSRARSPVSGSSGNDMADSLASPRSMLSAQSSVSPPPPTARPAPVADGKSNIRVFCRVRPLLDHELEEEVEEVIEYPGDNQVAMIRRGADKNSRGTKSFTFDRVFGPAAGQHDVFRDVKKFVSSVLDGFNVCIFAYGQTGSGKTYTMEGPPGHRGINYRALGAVFTGIKKRSRHNMEFKVHVSMMEIYNEQIRDLLDVQSHSRNSNASPFDHGNSAANNGAHDDSRLQVRKGPHGMYVTNMTRCLVSTPEEVMEVFATGTRVRAVGTTNMNEHSSRSHAILLVTVEGVDLNSGNRTLGKLYLVDLAGSERNKDSKATGQRFVEATYINRSLSALGDVMTALANPKKVQHVPYRNSKLTFLLQDSLGGNSRTMMFVNVSPADRCAQETMCSLQFARRVRKIQLSASAQVQNNILGQYKRELGEARERMRTLEDGYKRAMKDLKAQLRDKEETIYDLNEKLKTNTAQLHQIEIERRRERSALQSNTSRRNKQQVREETRRVEAKFANKQRQLNDEITKLKRDLSRSQATVRELRSSQEAVENQVSRQNKIAESSTRQLEERLDRVNRKASMEALARQKLEEQASKNLRKWRKELKTREEQIKVLHERNRRVMAEVSNLKQQLKEREQQHQEVTMRMRSLSPPMRSAPNSRRSSSKGPLLTARRNGTGIANGKTRRQSHRRNTNDDSDSSGTETESDEEDEGDTAATRRRSRSRTRRPQTAGTMMLPSRKASKRGSSVGNGNLLRSSSSLIRILNGPSSVTTREEERQQELARQLRAIHRSYSIDSEDEDDEESPLASKLIMPKRYDWSHSFFWVDDVITSQSAPSSPRDRRKKKRASATLSTASRAAKRKQRAKSRPTPSRRERRVGRPIFGL